MGAAASIEMNKPVDASDILESGSLSYASSEVIRLRSELGHLAKLAGIDVVVYDASDILFGVNEKEDFDRCVKEVAHIRQCLQLHTQSSRRKTRTYVVEPRPEFTEVERQQPDNNDSDDTSDDDDE